MNVKIACHSGFCLFQPVRKKQVTISANNTTLAKTLKGLKEGFISNTKAIASDVKYAGLKLRAAYQVANNTSYSVAA